MNKIVLIGNGFDIAHGIKTSYNDFMGDFEINVKNAFLNKTAELFDDVRIGNSVYIDRIINQKDFCFKTHSNYYKFNNEFIKVIIDKYNVLNYYDLEAFFYDTLKKSDSNKINKLNKDFSSFTLHLQKYLTKMEKQFKSNGQHVVLEVFKDIHSPIYFNELSQEAKNEVSKIHDVLYNNEIGKKSSQEYFYNTYKASNKSFDPEQILLINFNYTETADLYSDEKAKFINIHGKLNDEQNPIIFGYGDELDSEYSVIEKYCDNRFLEHFKSINYAKTDNYKKVLEYIDSNQFQVCVMGHSCGNTDRTLLNTIFEHNNCASVKIYYHQQSKIKDNYLDVYMNISRNFNNKAKLRDRVVSKSYCKPLITFRE